MPRAPRRQAKRRIAWSPAPGRRSAPRHSDSGAPAHELIGLGRILTPPKSEAGRRTVALPTFVLHALDHLKDYAAAPADSFVFTRHTGLPLRRQDLSHAWTTACAVVAIEGVHPHDLRHHAATVIARNPNVTLCEVMATIGHSSHVAALRYQHATAERSKESPTSSMV